MSLVDITVIIMGSWGSPLLSFHLYIFSFLLQYTEWVQYGWLRPPYSTVQSYPTTCARLWGLCSRDSIMVALAFGCLGLCPHFPVLWI